MASLPFLRLKLLGTLQFLSLLKNMGLGSNHLASNPLTCCIFMNKLSPLSLIYNLNRLLIIQYILIRASLPPTFSRSSPPLLLSTLPFHLNPHLFFFFFIRRQTGIWKIITMQNNINLSFKCGGGDYTKDLILSSQN